MTSLAAGESRIGWIGLGRMGLPMARRLRDAGWQVVIWSRRPHTEGPEAAEGFERAADLPSLARRCDAVITMVGGPPDVETLHAQLMPASRAGTLFIDMSTAAPATAQGSAALAEKLGHNAVDAPVTGGVTGAQKGTLIVFAGGSAEALQRCEALLKPICQRVVPCGPAGSGYRTKLINQTLMAANLMGVAEAARLARAAGLQPAWLQQTLAGGTGSSPLLDNYLPRMMSGDGPVTFTLGLLLKDLMLARAEARALDLPAPLLDAALAAISAAVQRHGAAAGLQALAQD